MLNDKTRQTSGEARSPVNEDDPVERHVVDVPVADWKWWSLESPHLYEVDIAVRASQPGTPDLRDRVTVACGFRTMHVDGTASC